MQVQASDRVYYVHQTLVDAEAALVPSGTSNGTPEEDSSESQGIVKSVQAALCDDLNTPQAIASLSEPLKTLNDLLHTKKVGAFSCRALLLCLASFASLIGSRTVPICCGMQGKKAEGRLASIKALHSAVKFALQLMGLDAQDSASLLSDLRTAALSRSVGWDPRGCCNSFHVYCACTCGVSEPHTAMLYAELA